MSTTKAARTAFDNLRTNQRQLDADGCEVGVSRQALDETLNIYAELLAALVRIADGPWPDNICDPYDQCLFDEKVARAAISKATGQDGTI